MTDDTVLEDRLDDIERKIGGIVDAMQFVMQSVGKVIKSPIIGMPDKNVTLAEGYALFCRLRDENTPRA